MTQIAEALEAIKPSAQDALQDSVTFSPIRWKTGWPHHLRRVPPFRDDATASITRAEVFSFAADVRSSDFAREQIIDFLGACFAYIAGQSNQVMQMQAFLRNKGNASKLLGAIRKLGGLSPVDAYASLVATDLAPKYASAVAYFLAGEQDAAGVAGVDGAAAPAIICSNRARLAGLSSDSDWTADEYKEYLDALTAARDAYDSSLPLDAVEWALREFARREAK
ncbi:hypothetical protein [Corynebacterium coyleae]|uniref:8-oxoguanine DNA glycosylase OGG fold protein n=1 Tax=Corynebacterium coyleae TaxID=53374 RepID=UPI00254A5F9F|nr:hypothetical protein [Corynebacterium coyleae]MDK8664478.1 hypothetical protein [Corynebacterium coyleae]MDK8707535.1 hypothetical protein [Corynebacterium coyleae]MDK8734381.1 hypothetical protein [Corynebacterium coyleae]MDK8893630.1 hypothetical protein [Corynebacterium coyleae]